MKNSILFTSFFFSLALFGQMETTKTSKLNLEYVARIDAGFLGGNEFSKTFHVHNGVSFYNHFMATVGLGYQNYYGYQFLPVALDFRYSVLKTNENRKTTPFISVSSGYLQPLDERTTINSKKMSLTAGSKIGVTHFFSKHVGFETSVGYRFSRMEINNTPDYGWMFLPVNPITNESLEYNMLRFELSVGFVFK